MMNDEWESGPHAIHHSSVIIHHSSLSLPRGRHIELIAGQPKVMAVLNITPDSFSDGGVHFDHLKAIHAAMQMEEDGAAVIDVGGESTRPGAAEVSVDEEIARVVPVI